MWTCKDCGTKWSHCVEYCRICKNKKRIAYNREKYKRNKKGFLKGGK